MSIQIFGDGSATSSIAFTTITLPTPALTREVLSDNVEIIEGDGGWTVAYEKGTYRRIFPYVFSLLSQTQKDTLFVWWELIKGRLNWFSLFPHEYPLASEQIQQQYTGGSNYIIQNTVLNQSTNFWRGWWVIVRSGLAINQRRKIYQSGSNQVLVTPVFNNTIAVNDYVTLAYPVELENSEVTFSLRLPNFWDVNLTFKEKIMS